MARSFIFWTRFRGFSLINMLIVSVVGCALAIVAMNVFPSVNEYFTILKTVQNIARTARSPEEAKALFSKQSEVEYSIRSIKASDLLVTMQKEKLVISFAYDKEILILEPVYILIKYRGRSS
jgi:hypothetical protein